MCTDPAFSDERRSEHEPVTNEDEYNGVRTTSVIVVMGMVAMHAIAAIVAPPSSIKIT
jgi:hypothetical protein